MGVTWSETPKTGFLATRPKQGQLKNKCVSGNGSEKFSKGGNTFFFQFFFLENNIILCILKGKKMHKIIFFPKNLKKF